jgi:threonine dehydrogenase-like Zn-dependent dehydrogenase
VNFAAQQNRALNLIWALAKDGRLQPDDRVAVIGAGLTGLTAAAGLIAHE